MAGILRQFASDYVARHSRQAAPQVRSTLAKLSLCRTAALGGRMLACAACEHRYAVYNSCGDRHCPQCAGAKRGAWLEATRRLLLPTVDYFQVVFTLPEELSALCLGNRRPLYKLLFTAAWQALREALMEECGFEPAALLVLHTWNQRLEHHPHVHALVPGGGPSLAGDRWIKSRHPRHRRRRKPYLVDNQLLSQRFRRKFLAGVKRLQRQGALRLDEGSAESGGASLAALLGKLETRPWVVFIEAPPHDQASPDQVLKYLARYLTGGPISDRRLVAQTERQVTFLARSTEKPADGSRPAQVSVPLDGVEFTRRWALHILPKGFTKVRRFGGYSNRHCQAYLQRCRRHLDLHSADDGAETKAEAQATEPADSDSSAPRCPHCSGLLICVAAAARPTWRDVMSSPDRPHWYRDG